MIFNSVMGRNGAIIVEESLKEGIQIELDILAEDWKFGVVDEP